MYDYKENIALQLLIYVIYPYIHTLYIYTYIHTYLYTYIHTYIQTNIQTYKHYILQGDIYEEGGEKGQCDFLLLFISNYNNIII